MVEGALMSKVEQRPVIGIVPTQVPDEDIVRVNDHYTKAIIASGAAPLVLPISSDLSVYESIFPLLNGFILTGGQDIDPARYGGPSTYEKLSDLTPQREEVECLILSYAYRYDIPTLGICRGMQVMNVFFGGTLYLDLADQFQGGDAAHLQQGSCGAISSNGICPVVGHWQKDHYEQPTHFVKIVRASKLGSILADGELATNSMHHQGVRDVAPLLDPVAYGPDGLVEAIEVRDRTFMMGVQWHPEYFAGEQSMGCIFKTLSMEASKARSREERLREKGLHIERQDAGGRWPSIHFADCI